MRICCRLGAKPPSGVEDAATRLCILTIGCVVSLAWRFRASVARRVGNMPQCPQCQKPLRELVRRCPSCQADLDLLVDYVSHLQGGLERAEHLTRAGELGQAVWAYLEVLEVDPDNATARRQVTQVATAVRQFDYAVPGRRWANNLPPL